MTSPLGVVSPAIAIAAFVVGVNFMIDSWVRSLGRNARQPMTDIASPILRVEDLRVETDTGIEIVAEVNFEAHRGEVLAIVGESGSGKTTVGMALFGYARRGTRIAVVPCGSMAKTYTGAAFRKTCARYVGGM